ncbi:amidase [Micromonospora mirobrigensis]|uniref:Amidase n=1 Tax=Micromonospora mirobrigensis TaxID=262898 RepID=A0A1C5AKZ7_9ACTN|nr:amidase [Micromonospora mirobrigensis]SCF45887.1 amidase [Micromonospora mirobrigensis]
MTAMSPLDSASELAAAIRAGDLSATDVVRAYLDRIDRLNPTINALVTVDVDGALSRARQADAALAAGDLWGPLHGVPFTVKDSFETAGIRTTSSYRPLADHIPDRDATAVERLRQAGAIVLGKTNMPELERDVQSMSPLFGTARNPWDLARTPGGSTGGGAAAVSAGLTALELGSDTAGSVRIPAHYTGVYALKPTEHRVSLAGKIPPRTDRPRGMRHLSVAGVIARSVDDLVLWLTITEGLDPRDPDTAPPAPPNPRSRPAVSRLALIESFPGVPVDVATRAALAALADRLSSSGVTVERVAPDIDWTEALVTYAEMWGAECGLGLPGAVRTLAPVAALVTPRREIVARAIVRGMRFDMSGYAAALTRRDTLIRTFDAFLSRYDALLLPVTSGPAFTHRRPGLLRQPDPIEVDGQSVPYDLATLGYTAPLNALGNPVVVMPLPRPAGSLPIGVQVVGRRWDDHHLLAVASALSATTGPFVPPAMARA